MKTFRLYHLLLAIAALWSYLSGDQRDFPIHLYISYALLFYIGARLLAAFSSAKMFDLSRFSLSFKNLNLKTILQHPIVNNSLLVGIALSLIAAFVTGIALEGGRTIGLDLPRGADRHMWKELHSLASDFFLFFTIAHVAYLLYAKRKWAFFMMFIQKK